MTVLLIDRDADTRQMYAEFLRHEAMDFEEAADGREGLAKALARPHDVIITETRLPGIDGYELCQLLRRDGATAHTPIIVLSGDGLPRHVERARKAGADAVLVKPCLPDVLVTEVQRQCRRARALHAVAGGLQQRAKIQLARSVTIQQELLTRRRALSRTFIRAETTTPPAPAPALVCPSCDQPLAYRKSHVGGVSELHREQWDYFDCGNGCGTFQYRQRTRKLRRVS